MSVNDLDEACKTLKEKGVKFVAEPKMNSGAVEPLGF